MVPEVSACQDIITGRTVLVFNLLEREVAAMRMGPEASVEGLYAAWMIQDRDGMLAYLTDDVYFAQMVSPAALRHAGISIGRGKFGDRADMVFRDWAFDRIVPRPLTVSGHILRYLCDFSIRFRRTGDVLDGTMRSIFFTSETKIYRIEEYHDAARFEAFMRLANSKR
jgi:ketosteroid isomerase-like protein